MSVFLLLACSGDKATTPPPEPAPVEVPAPASEPEPWIDDAVATAVEWEIMPGTDGEATPERLAEVRAFFEAHPEYADDATRAKLEDPACGLGSVEAAHEHLQKTVVPEPLVVVVDRPDQAVLIAHADVMCTSDDWSWYTHEALEAAEELGAKTGYASAENTSLIVRSGDRDLATVQLEGQGFLGLKPGGAPHPIEYDPTTAEEVRAWLSD